MNDNIIKPFSLHIFLADGNPDGLKIIERSNWKSITLSFNRSDYKKYYKRSEFNNSGIYILIGNDNLDELPTVYIGQADVIKNRLNYHDNLDFWTWCIFFTSSDNSLNKAHITYLEARLLDIAKNNKRCILTNSQFPKPAKLAEWDLADLESFLSEMLLILPISGLSIFQTPGKAQSKDSYFYIKSKDDVIIAEGYENGPGMVVCKGSFAKIKETPSQRRNATALRETLLEQGVLIKEKDHYVFTQDYTFNSPSIAATVILARSSNGRTEWKTKAGQTLKEVQSEID